MLDIWRFGDKISDFAKPQQKEILQKLETFFKEKQQELKASIAAIRRLKPVH